LTNRLSRAASLYLRQHADNPVDWYSWGEEALSAARTLNKPILLSIGYSACHWCHVMAHESFEDEDTASTMNNHFINIKVDREERPDIDSIYMAAVQAMTGHGGWPLTVFLTPDGRPFYGGTYFPPVSRHGLPAFKQVLEAVAAAFREQPDEVYRSAEKMTAALIDVQAAAGSPEIPAAELLNRAFQAVDKSFDPVNGGFGGAPKFPQPLVIEFMLRYYHRTGRKQALAMAETTLRAMYRGGIYDHLGGGFHRYSTDSAWQIPHFEKMLYDNALISRTYVHAFQLTGEAFYRVVAEDIFKYILMEMTDSTTGGFFSSQDADSEGVEGKYYTWTDREIEEVLGAVDGDFFRNSFGISKDGNFDGRNILHLTGNLPSSAGEIEPAARARLLKYRQKRPPPAKDTKIITSWNAMMLASLAEAAGVFNSHIYRAAAEKCGNHILDTMYNDGLLLHTPSVDQGFLEDYSQFIDALLWLNRTSLKSEYLSAAVELADKMIELFWDDGRATFYDAPTSSNDLFKRPVNLQDGATPSGSSAGAFAALNVAAITGNQNYRKIANKAFSAIMEHAAGYPLGFGHWLSAFDYQSRPSQDVVIVGNSDDPETIGLAGVLPRKYRPDTLAVVASPRDHSLISELSIFRGKPQLQGKPTAYVCRNFSCLAPVEQPVELQKILDGP